VARGPLRQSGSAATRRSFPQRRDRQGTSPGHRRPRRTVSADGRSTPYPGSRLCRRRPQAPGAQSPARPSRQYPAYRVRGAGDRDDPHSDLSRLSLADWRARQGRLRLLRPPSLRASSLLRRSRADGHEPPRRADEIQGDRADRQSFCRAADARRAGARTALARHRLGQTPPRTSRERITLRRIGERDDPVPSYKQPGRASAAYRF
jgi:hypothetical protein